MKICWRAINNSLLN